MTVNKIKEKIKGTNLHFDKVHDFQGVHDRYIERHDVLLYGDNYRIIAQNKTRTKWIIYNIITKEKSNILSLDEIIETVKTL